MNASQPDSLMSTERMALSRFEGTANETADSAERAAMNEFKVGSVVSVSWDKTQGYTVVSDLPEKGKDCLLYEVKGIRTKKTAITNSKSMILLMKSEHFTSTESVESLSTTSPYYVRTVEIDYGDGRDKQTMARETYDWLWLMMEMKISSKLARKKIDQYENGRYEQMYLF